MELFIKKLLGEELLIKELISEDLLAKELLSEAFLPEELLAEEFHIGAFFIDEFAAEKLLSGEVFLPSCTELMCFFRIPFLVKLALQI